MRVQHNITAMNSYRNYNNNTSMINKNLEKLSSGYKINRAGDDAAGLAISEKMRAQITGLEGAQKNAKDGIRLVQTAEGALTEVHSMLNRMVTLAEQSANGTYSNETDREQLQKEVEQLRSEINRIADSSNFNGTKLLDGSLSGTGATTAAQVKLGDNVIATKVTATKNTFTYPVTGTSSMFAGAEGDIGPSNPDYEYDTTNHYKGVEVCEYTFTYAEDANAKDKAVSISLEWQKKESGVAVLVGSSGSEYAIADSTNLAPSMSELKNALMSEVNKTKLVDKFDITESSGSFTFKAKDAGTSGAVLKGFSVTYDKGGSDEANTALGLNVDKGTDEGKKFEADGVTLYDGSNAEDAVFTINGQKFAFANVSHSAAASGSGASATPAVDPLTQAQVDALGKNVTILDTAGASVALTAEHAKIIGQKTGLNVEFNAADATAGTVANITLRAGTSTTGSGGLKLQIGDTGESFNQLQVNVGDVHANALGIGSVDISDASDALTAMDDIKAAINIVSDIRGGLGAIQNRLEHTINNLSVMQENIQDAESTIRDTDVADEMMKYTKNSILVQSAQAMLAQANQQPQGVLQLLQ